jgi:hypothetical protein
LPCASPLSFSPGRSSILLVGSQSFQINKGLAGQNWERARVSGNRLLPRPPERKLPPLGDSQFSYFLQK